MFDPNLTLNKAYADVEQSDAVVFDSNMDAQTIALGKETSVLRNRCFQNADTYQSLYPQVVEKMALFRRRLVSTAPFQCIAQHFEVYGQAIPSEWSQAAKYMSFTYLDEAVSNAMQVSDSVRVQLRISSKGLLIDVDQGAQELPVEFIQDVRAKAEAMLRELSVGKTIQALVQEYRTILRTPIGYVPPGLPATDGSPYRGNGVSNIVINDLFRVNYIPGNSENHTLVLSTVDQVGNAMRFKHGDRSVLPQLYGPSEAAIDTTGVDELFRSFDMKDFLP